MSKITAQAPSLMTPAEDAVRKTPPPIRNVRKGPLHQVVSVLASLRLTVTLFTFGVLLVFFGTLAQMDDGLWMVLHRYFRTWGIAWIPNQTLVRFGQVFFGVSKDVTLPGTFPLPGGFLIGSWMFVNLLMAYATRYRYTWKRAGVLVLHGGVIVLMLGEFYYGTFGVESRMRIPVNGSSNFIEHHDKVELAVIDRTNPKEDDVVVIPGSILKQGGTIQDERLPFDIEVKQYMVNASDPISPPKDKENPATAGIGKVLYLSAMPLTPGVDGQRTDHPTAYVTFKEKGSGRLLGTYLVSTWLADLNILNAPFLRGHISDPEDATQLVALNGKPYDVSLRAERAYKPYTLTLKEFKHGRYPGTEIAKDYSSLVQLVDPSRSENREVKISMNSPLRYENEAFYQSGVLPNDSGTILQVVRNEGWLLPYIACAMVSFGMLFHFGTMLVAFLKKVQLTAEASEGVKLSAAERFVPRAVFGLGAVFIAMTAMQPGSAATQSMHLDEFRNLPVQNQGRFKPMDTIARESLLAVSNRQEEYIDKDGKSRTAVEWLLNVLTHGGNEDRIFRIENDQVLAMLGLEARPGSFRYSIAELAPKFKEVAEQEDRARGIEAGDRTVFDVKLLELAQRLQVYVDLTRWKGLAVVPPRDGGDEWQTLAAAWHGRDSKDSVDPAAESFLRMLHAYSTGNAAEFNTYLDKYQDEVRGVAPVAASKARFETFYNHFEPFMDCLWLYALAFFVTCAAWVCLGSGEGQWSRTLNRTAYWMILLALIVHTFGIGARMWIMDRPPITNLYSTAVYIGWGAVILGLMLEQWFPMGIGNAVAGVLGFLTAFIAHHLAHGEDTMKVLEPVLDTNFWLATHVVCINSGYAATLCAGFLGMGYIVAAWATRWVDLDDSVFKALSQMIYGIVCFALFLSFTGTVLGGIWADQSWGRFWGWDPKENGALLIVLVNAIVLHARWGGLVKQRGIAMLTVVGNMVTAWSWFGTNQLGVGLHAYGFNNTLATWLVRFWALELAFIALGLLLPYARLNYPGGRKAA